MLPAERSKPGRASISVRPPGCPRDGAGVVSVGSERMQLTRFSDISLRLLLYLASRDDDSGLGLVTARAASTTFNVPYTHMVKVVHRLGILGLLSTTRGKGGGLALARPARSIRIGEVLQMTEPTPPLVNCWEPECPLRFDCRLKHVLDHAQQAFFRELDLYTLADIATMPVLQQLVQLTSGVHLMALPAPQA